MGYGFSEHFEMMTELNYMFPREDPSEIFATVNLGMRLSLSDNSVFISSIATGIINPSNEPRTNFMSYMGMQLNF